MSTANLPFERLKGRENYGTWCVGAKAYLIRSGLAGEMDKDIAELKDDTMKASNAKALAELTLMLDASVYTYIEGTKTVKEAWNALAKAFQDSGAV